MSTHPKPEEIVASDGQGECAVVADTGKDLPAKHIAEAPAGVLGNPQRGSDRMLGQVEGAQDGLGVGPRGVVVREFAQVRQDGVVVCVHVLEAAQPERRVVLADAQDLPGPAQE